MKRLVIFDLDGTLIDSLADLADSVNAVLSQSGLPTHPIDAYRHFVGDGFATLVRRALPQEIAESAAADTYRQRMHEEYGRRWLNKTVPYPGIVEMLAELERLSVQSAILSNKPDAATRHITRVLFPNHPFVLVRGGLTDTPLKPDPAGAVKMLQQLNREPRDTLYVGDTNTDMRTGKSAGLKTLGVSWGFRPVEELVESGADAIVDQPSQIIAHVR
jgi:phosphoglycolate phosphatase